MGAKTSRGRVKPSLPTKKRIRRAGREVGGETTGPAGDRCSGLEGR